MLLLLKKLGFDYCTPAFYIESGFNKLMIRLKNCKWITVLFSLFTDISVMVFSIINVVNLNVYIKKLHFLITVRQKIPCCLAQVRRRKGDAGLARRPSCRFPHHFFTFWILVAKKKIRQIPVPYTEVCFMEYRDFFIIWIPCKQQESQKWLQTCSLFDWF